MMAEPIYNYFAIKTPRRNGFYLISLRLRGITKSSFLERLFNVGNNIIHMFQPG